jgi:hypothetical protein
MTEESQPFQAPPPLPPKPDMVGQGSPGMCRVCGQPGLWGKTAAGRRCFFDKKGYIHFKTCTKGRRR